MCSGIMHALLYVEPKLLRGDRGVLRHTMINGVQGPLPQKGSGIRVLAVTELVLFGDGGVSGGFI